MVKIIFSSIHRVIFVVVFFLTLPASVFSQDNPVPVVTSISPTERIASLGNASITIRGTGFLPTSTVLWNGSPLSIPPSRTAELLVAGIPAKYFVAVGTAQVVVVNPPPGGGTSQAFTFTITMNPEGGEPEIAQISPRSVAAGGPGFELIVDGAKFVPGAVVQWDREDLETFFVSSAQLIATVPASRIATQRGVGISVFNPGIDGGRSTNVVLISIAAPLIETTSPRSVQAGGASFDLTVIGKNFLAGSSVTWNGSPRNTTFVNHERLVAEIGPSDISATGRAEVAVENPGGSTSNKINYLVAGGPFPIVTAISPSTVSLEDFEVPLRVFGENFDPDATILLDGSRSRTVWVSERELIYPGTGPLVLLSRPGYQVDVAVQNHNAAISNPLSLTYNTPTPVITALNPGSALAGSFPFYLNVLGYNLYRTSVALWDGLPISTPNYNLSSSLPQVRTRIPSREFLTSKVVSIRVATPPPGGEVSEMRPFWVVPPSALIPLIVVNPRRIPAGSGDTEIEVRGTNFEEGAVGLLEGVTLPTTVLAPDLARMTIPAEELLKGGNHLVQITNPSGATSPSGAILTFFEQTPTITAVSGRLDPGGRSVTITVQGTNFTRTSQILTSSGNPLASFVSPTELRARVPVDWAFQKEVLVSVTNPFALEDLHSGRVLLSLVSSTGPSLFRLTPPGQQAGGGAFLLTVDGEATDSGLGSVLWNGSPRSTLHVGPERMLVRIAASDLSVAGTVQISVLDEQGNRSNNLPFFVNEPPPRPTITSLSPTGGTIGGPAFELTVIGSGYINGSTVQWNGVSRTTVFQGSTELVALIQPEDVRSPGTADIRVVMPGADRISNSVEFLIGDVPVPSIGYFEPASAVAGGEEFTAEVHGENFINGSRVLWNGAVRPTTFVSANVLQFSVLRGDIGLIGAAQLTVVNPAAAQGTGIVSAPAFFPVFSRPELPPSINPRGAVNAATLSDGTVFAPGSIVSLFGTGLAHATESANALPLPRELGGTTVWMGTLSAPLLYVSPQQINFQVPWQLRPGPVQLRVAVDGETSISRIETVAAFAPGVFTVDQSGTGQGAILISGTSTLAAPEGLYDRSRPVRRGIETISIFASGLGPVTNPPPSGVAANADLLSTLTSAITVTIGGVSAPIRFSGLAPGFAGLYQIDVLVPSDAPTGNEVPLTLAVGGVTSNSITLAVH